MPVLRQGAAPAVEVFGSVAVIPLSMLPLLMLTRFLIFMISEEEDSMLELLVIIALPVSRLLICLTGGGRPRLLSKSCLKVILSASVPRCL